MSSKTVASTVPHGTKLHSTTLLLDIYFIVTVLFKKMCDQYSMLMDIFHTLVKMKVNVGLPFNFIMASVLALVIACLK